MDAERMKTYRPIVLRTHPTLARSTSAMRVRVLALLCACARGNEVEKKEEESPGAWGEKKNKEEAQGGVPVCTTCRG